MEYTAPTLESQLIHLSGDGFPYDRSLVRAGASVNVWAGFRNVMCLSKTTYKSGIMELWKFSQRRRRSLSIGTFPSKVLKGMHSRSCKQTAKLVNYGTISRNLILFRFTILITEYKLIGSIILFAIDLSGGNRNRNINNNAQLITVI